MYYSLRDDYLNAINGIQKHLVRRSKPNNLLFIGQLKNEFYYIKNNFQPKMVLTYKYSIGLHHLIINSLIHSLFTGAISMFFTRYTSTWSSLRNAKRTYATSRRLTLHLLPDLRSASHSLGTRSFHF